MHAIDTVEFRDFLEREVPQIGRLVRADRFKGGQSNPTYKLTTDTGSYVLRARPLGTLLKSAHKVDREFRVMTALRDTPVPVPRTIYLSPEETPIKAQFYLMDWVDGVVHWDPALLDQPRELRQAITLEMADVLAALHAVDPADIGLGDYGPEASYLDRQMARWTKQYAAAVAAPSSEVSALVDWLIARKPAVDSGRSIVHGDYRLDNLMFERKAATALAVLDWELSTLGDPLSDLAYWCMCLRLPREGLVKGLAGIDRAAEGLPDEDTLIARYCDARGLQEVPHWDFYLAFSYFRLIAILEGVMRRAKEGNAANPTDQSEMRAAVDRLTADALTVAGLDG